MTNKEIFISKFISQFYDKAKTKRRHSKNQAYYISQTIKNVCKGHFDRNLKFSDEEIFSAFQNNGFLLLESGKDEFTWERFHSNHILIMNELFINIKSQSNADMKLVMRRTYPENYNPETVEKLVNLKRGLQDFWTNYKGLLNFD